MILAYEERLIDDFEDDFIIWDYIIYFMLAIFSVSTLVSFALIISCLLKKIFLSKYEHLNSRKSSTPFPSPLIHRKRRCDHHAEDGYDECDC